LVSAVAIKLRNGVAGIVGALEDNNTRSLGTTIRSDMDVGSNYCAVSSSLTEQVFEILPAYVEGKVGHIDLAAAATRSTTAGSNTAICRVEMAGHAAAAAEAAAIAASGSNKPRLSLTVLTHVD
jgi:hypothetical protein